MSFQVTLKFSGVVLSVALASRPVVGQKVNIKANGRWIPMFWDGYSFAPHTVVSEMETTGKIEAVPHYADPEPISEKDLDSDDPRISQLVLESGFVRQEFEQLLAAGAWKDHALLEMRKAGLTRFDTDDVSRRALEVYAARAARTDMPMPSQKVLEGMLGCKLEAEADLTSLTVKHTRKWVPSAADIVLALENQAADELVSDIVSDDSGMAEQEEDGLPDKVSGKAEAIADLQAYAGFGNSSLWYKKMNEVKVAQGFMEIAQGWGDEQGVWDARKALKALWLALDTIGAHDFPTNTIAGVMATLSLYSPADSEDTEEDADGELMQVKKLTPREERIIAMCLKVDTGTDTFVTGTMTKADGTKVTAERHLRYRKMNPLWHAAIATGCKFVAEEAVDHFEQSQARNDYKSHPEEDAPKVEASLDNQARMLDWLAATYAQAAAQPEVAEREKPWLTRPTFKKVLDAALADSNAIEANNRAYAADTLRMPSRVIEYNTQSGFRVVTNTKKGQERWVPVGDARLIFRLLPQAAKDRITELTKVAATAAQ